MTSGLTRIGAAAFGVLLLLAPCNSHAKPLSTETCVKLVNEHAELRKGGVEDVMERDPASAANAIEPEKLAKIERFLFIEGQIRFRCPGMRLPGIKEADLSKPQKVKVEKAEPKAPKKSEGPTVPLPQRKPARPKKKAG